MSLAAKLPACLRDSQRHQKRELVSKLARLPPDADSEEIRRRIEDIVNTARARRLAGERTLRELQVALRRSLLAGDIERARRELLDVLPDWRPRWPRVLLVAAVTLGAVTVGGPVGWMFRAVWVALVAIQILGVVLEPLVISTGHGKGCDLDALSWLEARLSVRDLETALATYRELRSRISEYAEADAQIARVAQANALYQLARSSLEIPLTELAGDARALAELPGSNEHWWTARALVTLAERLDALDPEESAKLRALHARVKPAADALAAQLDMMHRKPETS